MVPPPALSLGTAGDTNPADLVTIYFRRSADGVTFNITPVYLMAPDARSALNTSPAEYSIDGVTWAAWPSGYNNASQPIGGRGRLRSSPVACG
jgi:hypothetical protein